MKVCIFEDEKVTLLYPLSLTRPAFELKCGHGSLREKILRLFPGARVSYSVREYLAGSFKEKSGATSVNSLSDIPTDDCLFINGRWLVLDEKFEIPREEQAAYCGDDLLYLFAKKERLTKAVSNSIGELVKTLSTSLPKKEVKAKVIRYPWNLIQENPQALRSDFKVQGRHGIEGKIHDYVSIIGNPSDLYVAATSEVQPFSVLDTTGGPIYIDEGVTIYPHSRIEGPSFIGKGTAIYGANVREGCSIGPVCRVGGEVEESIFHAYSNKYHAGFIGHSYLGEWINLGAMTTNSDLKNDYSTVQLYVEGVLLDSGDTKVGSFIGDHTKTGLSTLLNTGTICGAMCNILPMGDLLPKFIPSFCWFFRGRFSKGKGFKSFLETARIAMSRRKLELTQIEAEMLRAAYDLTENERLEEIKKSRG